MSYSNATGIAEVDRIAYDRAWEWFKYHADQRLRMLRFFLVGVGAVATAYFTNLVNNHHIIAAFAAIFGAFLSFCFYRLDQRNSYLITCGERVLEMEQQKLRDKLGYDEILIMESADRKMGCFMNSYGTIRKAIFIMFVIAFLAGEAYIPVDYIRSAPPPAS